jgi:uncharacterized protein YukE
MSTNSHALATALDEYQAALARQVATLRGELEPLQRSWAALSAVYEGTAAEHFRAGWLRTERMLDDYLATAERLRPFLSERLDALRDADRPNSDAP